MVARIVHHCAFLLVAISFVTHTNASRADVPIHVPKLKIILNDSSSQSKSNRPTLIKSCQIFAEDLIKNRGLVGSGPFADVACLNKNDRETQVDFDWTLTIDRDDDGNLKFTTIYGKGEKTVLVSEMMIATDLELSAFLGNKRLIPIVAARVSLAMPFFATKKGKWLTDSARHKGRIEGLDDIKLPQELYAFTLRERDGIFHPNIAGVFVRDREDDADSAEITKVGATSRVATWAVVKDSVVPEEPEPDFYFLQCNCDRFALLKTLDKKIQTITDVIAGPKMLSENIYIGVRYGVPMLKGDSPLNHAPMRGAFVEFRKGFFSGLKFNYDEIPTASRSDELSVTKASWSRIQIGKSFGTTLSSSLINWLDLTPRLGITNLEYHVATVNEFDEPYTYEFSQHRAPTFGIELGAERRFSMALFRLWAQAAYSTGVTPIDRDYKAQTYRGGLDSYWTIFSIGKTQIALLGFGAFERTSVAKKLTEEEENSATPLISGLRLTNGYLGGGLSLQF